jgi:hypothetical protein
MCEKQFISKVKNNFLSASNTKIKRLKSMFYAEVQWAAVSTMVDEIKEPPQKERPSMKIAACHGN